MQKQFDMKNSIIKTKEEYEIACERVYELIHSSENPIEPNSKPGEEMELLSLLIENYEKENFSLMAPSPIEAIKFRMEQMNLKQTDIAPLFGGKTRISEVMNGKRPLTLRMIALLHKYLEIPFESLITENYKYHLSNLGKEQIMKISSIKKLHSGKNIAIA
jgi:HTH-type transcriptional regulator / antitoxin HigA